MPDEITLVANRILAAADYRDIFGHEADPTPFLKATFRRLTKILRPDLIHPRDLAALVQDAFTRLEGFYDEASEALANHRYGQPAVVATITTKTAVHRVTSDVAPAGDLCNILRARSRVGASEAGSTLKQARSQRDNDLLTAESTALATLASGPEQMRPFYPQLFDSFIHKQRRVNALWTLGPTDEWLSLNDLHYFPSLAANRPPIDTRHMVWIFRKLLMALDNAHSLNLVHGAVLPTHVFVWPEKHGLTLLDWCYSVPAGKPLKALIERWRFGYPSEVLAKGPATPATDIHMAAATMLFLMGATNPPHDPLPRPFRAFFRGCMLEKPSARPQNAANLLAEFDDLLERMGEPYWPRRFVPLVLK
jgi:hypothetical protein